MLWVYMNFSQNIKDDMVNTTGHYHKKKFAFIIKNSCVECITLTIPNYWNTPESTQLNWTCVSHHMNSQQQKDGLHDGYKLHLHMANCLKKIHCSWLQRKLEIIYSLSVSHTRMHRERERKQMAQRVWWTCSKHLWHLKLQNHYRNPSVHTVRNCPFTVSAWCSKCHPW